MGEFLMGLLHATRAATPARAISRSDRLPRTGEFAAPSWMVVSSGHLPELHAVGAGGSRRRATGVDVIGHCDCARKGFWIPRVVVGERVGNDGAVRTFRVTVG